MPRRVAENGVQSTPNVNEHRKLCNPRVDKTKSCKEHLCDHRRKEHQSHDPANAGRIAFESTEEDAPQASHQIKTDNQDKSDAKGRKWKDLDDDGKPVVHPAYHSKEWAGALHQAW